MSDEGTYVGHLRCWVERTPTSRVVRIEDTITGGVIGMTVEDVPSLVEMVMRVYNAQMSPDERVHSTEE
jgi:hypothetical protein